MIAHVRKQIEKTIAAAREEDGIMAEVTVAWPNTAIEPPNVGLWLKVDLLPFPSSRRSLGRPVARGGYGVEYRHTGSAQLACHAPAGEGSGRAHELADAVAALFRDLDSDGVAFGTPSYRSLGVTAGARWWRIDVDVPWTYDETA